MLHVLEPVGQMSAYSSSSKRACLTPGSQKLEEDSTVITTANIVQASVSNNQPRQFTQQGEKVAVYNDDTFYIGEALQIESESKTSITFMGG